MLLFHIVCSMIIRLYFLVLDELTPKSLCLLLFTFTKCIFGVEISPSHDHFPSTFPWHISFFFCSMLSLLQIQIDVENGPCMYRLFTYICFTYWTWWLSIAMLNTLWWTNILPWKITLFFMGKSTISTGPFSIAFCMFTRGYIPLISH